MNLIKINMIFQEFLKEKDINYLLCNTIETILKDLILYIDIKYTILKMI